jgi:hypothetical protein
MGFKMLSVNLENKSTAPTRLNRATPPFGGMKAGKIRGSDFILYSKHV